MEDISLLTDSFSEFLSEKTAQKKENIQGSLFSFVKEINNINFGSKLDSLLKSSENSFYFSSPGNEFLFIALDIVYNIAENGPARFTAADKKIKDTCSKFISNYESGGLPLFVGGMKFTVEHSDGEWKDFNDVNWFIPETIFCSVSGKNYLIYNYYAEQGLSKTRLTEKFSKKIDFLFNIKDDENSSSPRITNSAGLSPKDKKKWRQVIIQALDKIEEQELKKVVLARKVDLILSEELNMTGVLNMLRNDYPECSVFAFHKGSSTFFGATPEMLAKVSDKKIEIDAVAGSISRSSSGEEDNKLEADLLKSKKDLNEHQYVMHHLTDALKSIGKNITYNDQPSVKKLKNIQHLTTKISAELENVSLMNILKELHPTPAVCGFPKEPALNFIKKTENQKRGLYSGIIGWFNQDGEGEFAVSIRSAVTKGNKLTAYAGSGIIEGSEPDAEFEETEMKLKPILSLFNEKKD